MAKRKPTNNSGSSGKTRKRAGDTTGSPHAPLDSTPPGPDATDSDAGPESSKVRVPRPRHPKLLKASPEASRNEQRLHSESGPLAPIESWFASKGWTPWEFQRDCWRAYLAGRSGLVQVATGSGKTYAAYLGPLAELIRDSRSPAGLSPGLKIIYVTPLRAVSRDIELALREPVDELDTGLIVESRTGDTSSSVRARQRERLPHVLVTTPESLTLLLTRPDARAQLGGVRCVILDEWHELLASKRGSQTELAMARLRELSPMCRTWALSATLPNALEAARAAVGAPRRTALERGATQTADPVVIRADMDRPVVIDSILPREGLRLPLAGHLGLVMVQEVAAALDPREPTLIFTNTRSQAERWFHALLAIRPEWTELAALHHGSIDRAERERVEAGLKSGAIRIVVATSSLDLGVDFAPVERVLQIGSPKGIARLVQRAGRSSHRPRTPCRVTCVPTHALELIEIVAARDALSRGEVEPRDAIVAPLDVLTQHMVTCALGGGFEPEALYDEVRRAWSFRDLSRNDFDWCLAQVRHGGEALKAYPDYRRVEEDNGRMVVKSPRIAQLHRFNVGTITGDSTVEIRFLGGRSLGRIEENFIAGLSEGQKFVFAGKVLRYVMFQDMVAYVRPGYGQAHLTPIWGGTRLPISESLSRAIRQTLEELGQGRADCAELAHALPVAAIQQRESIIPAARDVLIEITRTREGTHAFVFPFEGRLVHGGLAAIIALRLTRQRKATFSIAANDYGFEILSAEDVPFETLLTPELFSVTNLAADAAESAGTSLLAKLQFREVARVSGLVIQSMPGRARSGKQLQANSSLIYDVLSEFDPGNLLLAQARREVMERHFEESRLGRTCQRLSEGHLRIVVTRRPTPLSFPLLIERQAGRLSSETILERVQRMRDVWQTDPEGAGSPWKAASHSGSTLPTPTWDDGLPIPKIEQEPASPRPKRRRPPRPTIPRW
ncbi:MAG: ligase-associated DNA damage response DEXH box helicase [Tepidisphaera sp.]|nr:ligase-associated DNA damage response DEXH box helicase [Tepidisphaera sp.]